MFVRASELRAGDVLHLGGLKGPVVRWTVEGARAAGAQMIVDVVGAGGGRSALTLHRERVVVVRREDEDEVRDGAVALRELLCEIGQGAVDQRVIDAIVADAYARKRAAVSSDMRGLAAREAIVVHDVEA